MAKSEILCSLNSNSNPNPNMNGIWDWDIKAYFCRNKGRLIKNMDKGFRVPKWLLIDWQEIPQMSQNLPSQFVHPRAQKFGIHIAKKGFIGRPWSMINTKRLMKFSATQQLASLTITMKCII